jgi:WD40 repeat protein
MTGPRRRGLLAAMLGAAAIPGRAAAYVALHGAHEAVQTRIDAGAHLQRIENLFIDVPHGRLVSVSTDGTIRFWDLGTGEPQRVIWLPTSSANTVQKSGMSRSGALLGVGIYSGNGTSLLLFRDKDEPVIRPMPDVVSAVAFAPDDQSVAIATQREVTVLTLPDFRPVLHDTFADVVWALDFNQHGALAVGSFAGEVRLYNPAHQVVARGRPKAGEEITDLRFSPDGTLIALGFNSGLGNEVLRVPALQSAGILRPREGSPAEFARVSWMGGTTLLTSASESGSTAGKRPRYFVLEWTIGAAGNSIGDARVKLRSTGDLLTLSAVPDTGSFAVGLWDGALFRAAGSGQIWGSAAGKIYFDEENADRLFISDNGLTVALASPNPERAFRLDLLAGRLTAGGDTASLHPPVRAVPGLTVTIDDGITINGTEAPLDRWESVSGWAIDAKSGDVFVATRFHLRRYMRDAASVWAIAPGAEAWAVSVTNDGRYVIATLGDGTIRWYETREGGLVLSVFVRADRRRWVAWTAGGYFTGSDDASSLLKGFKAEFYSPAPMRPMDPAAFEREFHTPDLLTRLFAQVK